MLMVGYAFNHPSDTYEMYNPATDTIVVSNSIKWSSFTRWDLQATDPTIKNLLQDSTRPPITVIDDDISSSAKVKFNDSPPQVLTNDQTILSSDDKSLSLDTLDESPAAPPHTSPRRTRSQGFQPPPVVALDNSRVHNIFLLVFTTLFCLISIRPGS